jgi:hypothetical protein
MNPRGVVAEWNSAAERLFGWSREQILGRPLLSSVFPASRARVEQELDRLTRESGGGLYHHHFRASARTRDGRRFPADLTVSVIPVRGGATVSAFVEDISDQIRLEEARLVDQQRGFQRERLETLGQLAGGIAHDFNNLLEVIVSYAGLAADELEQDSPVRGDVQEIERAARRAADLTRQLLTFSRREVAKVQVLDLNQVIRELEPLLRRTLGEHIELEIRIGPDPCRLLGDVGQLEQVLVNLAVNARDAMPRGGQLRIATELAEVGPEEEIGLPSGRYVSLTVSDTGSGMTKDVAERAYEPFFTTKPRGRGTGLGLSTVYGVVTASGGQLGLTTAPDMGTTFVLHFPAATDAAAIGSATIDQVPQTRERLAPATRPAPDETILLVEDEETVRRALTKVLEREGYRVLPASEAKDALDILDAGETPIDLVVTDVVLPGLSGGDLAAELAIRHPELPTVFISGYTDDGAARRQITGTRRNFISKPFTGAALITTVADCLKGVHG